MICAVLVTFVFFESLSHFNHVLLVEGDEEKPDAQGRDDHGEEEEGDFQAVRTAPVVTIIIATIAVMEILTKNLVRR